VGRVAVDSGRWLVAQLQRGREGGLVWVRLLGLGPAQPHSGLGNIENREIKKAFMVMWVRARSPTSSTDPVSTLFHGTDIDQILGECNLIEFFIMKW